jgi:hypothetical protein
MAGIALSVLLTAGAVAQLAAPAGRYLIALEHRGPGVAFAEHPLRCGPDRASRDLLWGTVEGNETEADTDAVVYEGVMQRVTEQTLCGAARHATSSRPTPVPAPCRAALSGAADVKVRIKIYRRAASLQGAWIVLTPVDTTARVTGNCRSGEMREMQRAYGDRTTIEIVTPPDRLTSGRYTGDIDPATRAGWILNVAPSPPVVPSS